MKGFFNHYLAVSGGLIALYLALNYASGGGTLIREGAAGLSSVTKTFQGR
ncbi:hypothetical protein AB0K51_12400 [Kitasatospora sp. NPDC049285]